LTLTLPLFILVAPFAMTQDTRDQPTTGPSPRGDEKPLIVQSDRTILAEVASPGYPEARDALARFAELVKSPEHVHTYRITPLSIWNACAAGEKAEQIVQILSSLSRYPVPEHILSEIQDYAARFWPGRSPSRSARPASGRGAKRQKHRRGLARPRRWG
jgi:hypothetical protein